MGVMSKVLAWGAAILGLGYVVGLPSAAASGPPASGGAPPGHFGWWTWPAIPGVTGPEIQGFIVLGRVVEFRTMQPDGSWKYSTAWSTGL